MLLPSEIELFRYLHGDLYGIPRPSAPTHDAHCPSTPNDVRGAKGEEEAEGQEPASYFPRFRNAG